MKKLCLICSVLMASAAVFAQDAKAELLQTLQTQGIAEDLDAAPEGVTIRLLPDGGYQIFSLGTGTYDFDDVDDIADAREEATLNAKANLSKFMSESLSTDEKIEKVSATVKSISSENGETVTSAEKVSAKTALSNIRNSSAALLKGVIVLASEKVPASGSSGSYRVMLGVSSKTITAVGKLTGPQVVAGGQQPRQQPSSATTAVQPLPVQSAGDGLPDGWIECVGNGMDRQTAILAALVEGISQVYGISLQNDAKMKERMSRLKVDTDVSKVSLKEKENDTLSKTAGFVKEYRVIAVRNNGEGGLEAKIHALITNPRAGGTVAVMLYKPAMPLENLTKNYEIGPKRRMSGNEIANVVGKVFNRAFSGTNSFLVLDMEDLEKVLAQQEFSTGMVEAGLSPSQELLKAGQLLTADYILTSEIEDLKYSRKIDLNKETKKYGPVYKMSIRMSYKLTDAVTGQSLLSEVVSASLDNEEITALLDEDEDADLLLALMRKVSAILMGKIPQR